jgi:hypothetical protein
MENKISGTMVFGERIHHVYFHDLRDFGLLYENFGYRNDLPNTEQDEIVKRLIEYYHRMKSKENGGLNNDMWKTLNSRYGSFKDMLEQWDSKSVSQKLLTFCNTELVTCFENCLYRAEYYDKNNLSQTTYLIYNIIDKYLALGEAVGCLRMPNPEQGNWGYVNTKLNDIHSVVQRSIPFDMAPPIAAGGCLGISTDKGVISAKNLEAIYNTIKALALLIDVKERKVCEVGGGIGNLAYYLVKAGVDEVSSYELPIISVLQGYFLAKSLGQANVWFWGEPERPAKVKIFPYWAMAEMPSKYFSLAINQDSLPEIEESVGLSLMKNIAEKGNVFLSINQESGVVVMAELAQKTGFRRIQRHKYWMREGYVEEVYII